MERVASSEDLAKLLQKLGTETYLNYLIEALQKDFSRWEEFNKIPRPAFHVPDGVIELMPTADREFFAYKYVNGHPKNPESKKQTIVATGQLAKIDDGYPVFFSGMTLLTSLRTAATSAIASRLLAREDASTLALIGTGAQSEFQVISHLLVRNIRRIQYHDTDPAAMDKFEKNMRNLKLELVRCKSNEQAVVGADIITVCTACKKHVDVIENAWVQPGVHINALGGDCPGKTELAAGILPRAKDVVEFFEQSFIEGEIQRYNKQEAKKYVHAELWEILNGRASARETDSEITVFDSVGFALEDFSVLKLSYLLCVQHDIGKVIPMVPKLQDPKDLYSLLL